MGGKMSICDIVINLVISIISIFIALVIEKSGHPRFEFEIRPKKPVLYGDKNTFFLNLFVKNNPRSLPLVTRETAYSCHGTITFINESGNIVCNSMPIRWAGNPEPIKPEVASNRIVTILDPTLVKSSQYIDIPRDEEEELDICVRFQDDSNAYGWNSESYYYQGKNPNYKLLPGTYRIEVKLTCSGEADTIKFLLNNSENLDDFRIEPLN
jgi:hypothetical protein